MGRKIDELQPKVQAAVLAAIHDCQAAGLEVLISCTYRSPEEQQVLYNQGRTTPGKIVTNAKPGQSFHQYRVAIDLYPLVSGKPDFTGKALQWTKIAKIFQEHGFEWGFNWTRFKEMPHFQMTGGHPLAYFQAGGLL